MAKRRPLIAANWKMNGLTKDSLSRAKGLVTRVKKLDKANVEVLICPPFTMLHAINQILKGSMIKLGGQDCHYKNFGAYTGDIAPLMLRDAGCKYVILGHSERRSYYNEIDKLVKSKAEIALKSGLKVIICVGENLADRTSKKTKRIIRQQLRNSVPANANASNTVIAYEPIWAIGTGKTATPTQVQDIHYFLRQEIANKLKNINSDKIRIIYGGSVKPENSQELMAEPDVDGGLIGGASLVVSDFFKIMQNCS